MQKAYRRMQLTMLKHSEKRSISAICKVVLLTVLLGIAAQTAAFGHGVAEADEAFLVVNRGLAFVPYLYLGAKHMVTGYDHLLFLAGVIFFLYRLRDVALYVSLFAVGHSLTLLIGVLGGIHANPFLIDAVIGLSVSYKALENMGGFRAFGFEPDTRAAVFLFGLVHGFGLATKLQDVALSKEGLIGNMLAFNLGVELGQFAALGLILLGFNLWRASGRFLRHAYLANTVFFTCGMVLFGYQLAGYFQP